MSFTSGDDVIVRALNRRGRVVDVQGDRYRVSVGALTMVVREDELRQPEGGKRKRSAVARGAGGQVGGPQRTDRPPRRIDLHGMTTEAAREAVLKAVNDAVLAGDEALEIVHGIGTGRVREAVWKELKKLTVVRHVRAHPTNRGATIVEL